MDTTTRMTTPTGRRFFIASGCLFEAHDVRGSTADDLAIYCGDEFARAKPKAHIYSVPKATALPGESCKATWNRLLAECEE